MTPTQIVEMKLGRNFGSPYNGKSFMRQEVELKIRFDPRSMPLQLCWDVQADGAKLPWWQWYQYTAVEGPPPTYGSVRIWELPLNKYLNRIVDTGCWWGPNPDFSNLAKEQVAIWQSREVSAVIRISYQEPDFYYPTPYKPRRFNITATLTDAQGVVTSTALQFDI